MSFEDLWNAAPAVPAPAPVQQQQPWNMQSMGAALPQQYPMQTHSAVQHYTQPATAAYNPFAELEAAANASAPAPAPAPAPVFNPRTQQPYIQQQPVQPTYYMPPPQQPVAPVQTAPTAGAVDPFQMFFGLSQGMSAATAAPAPVQQQQQPVQQSVQRLPQQQSLPSAATLSADMLNALSPPPGQPKPKGAPVPAPAPLSIPPAPVRSGSGTAAASSEDAILSPHANADFDQLFASATPVSVSLAATPLNSPPTVDTNSNYSESAFDSNNANKPPSVKRIPSNASAEGGAAASVVSPRSRKGGAASSAAVASPKGALDLSTFKALAASSPKAAEIKVASPAVASKASTAGAGKSKSPAAPATSTKSSRAASSASAASSAPSGPPPIEAFTTRRIQRLQPSGFEYVISPMGSELESDEVINDSGSQSFARNIQKIFCRADIWEAPNGQFDVKGEWFADGHSVNVPGTLTEVTTEGQLLGFVQFTFPKGTNFKLRNRWITFNAPIYQWPPGNYHLKVSFGTLHTERVDFSIRPDSD